MRKISLILVIFMLSAPAWARVDVVVEQNEVDVNSFNVRYFVTGEVNDVRAFALDISADKDVNIVEVNDFHVGESNSVTPGYGIFPSSFASKINPEVLDWDASGYTPLGNKADYPDDTLDGLDTNGITVELGSLYDEDVNKPSASGILLELVLDPNHAEECNTISLSLNQIRGGIVLEDPDQEVNDVNLVGWERDIDCLIGGNAGTSEHSDWVAWGKPPCWCYQRQCRGDADGKRTGPYWVAIPDLNVIAEAYGARDNVLVNVVVNGVPGICADFDHKRTGPYRVAIPDLNIIANYYGQRTVPVCNVTDPPNYPTLYTGPYDHWTN